MDTQLRTLPARNHKAVCGTQLQVPLARRNLNLVKITK